MTQPGMLTYLRHKLLVTLMRSLAGIFTYLPTRRDRLLGEKTYGITGKTISIPSRDKGRKIKGCLYAPPSASTSPNSRLPVLVNWHGSGFVLPLFGSDALFCAKVAEEAGIYVLDADYRKAPEHPFPLPGEDVEDVLKWVATQGDRFDTMRVGVSGFSAGGNLALVAASSLRKSLTTSGVEIKLVAALYPVTDISIPPASKSVTDPIKPIPPRMATLFNDCYVPDVATRKDPRVSPGLAKAEEFPETVLMVTCAGDTLLPEAEELARKVEVEGRKVISVRLEGVGHGFDKGVKQGSKEGERREEAYKAVVEAIKERLL